MKKLLLSLALVLPILALPQAAAQAANTGAKAKAARAADQAAKAPGKVTVTPSTVLPRVAPCSGVNDFTVSGKGFKPYEMIDLTVGGLAYDSFQADAAGAYEQENEIKAVPSGYLPVKLTGNKGTKAQAEIRLGWAGCWMRSHGVLTVRGAGFAADDQIDVILDGEIVEVAESDARGRFEAKVDCPAGDPTLEVEGEKRSLTFKTVDC
ncbi:hypothetical protein AB0M54_01920 [Actinoplanes sp. NPDC051470]|uniref:hypothetical protein n=1 Tax=Actinoplanes sp. NPDC051470 TaxID=3157224 RepID=UPI003447FD22